MQNLLKKVVISFILITAMFGSGAGQTRSSAVSSKIEPLISEATEALEKKDLGGAKTTLLRALKIAPGNFKAHTLMGIVADQENDLKTAEKHFALAARYAPDSPEAQNNYGAILLRSNRRKEAAQAFTASLKINPNQLSALINLAQIRFEENNLKSARELFEKAQAIQKDAEIARALLVISLRLKETERARREYQEYFSLTKNSGGRFAGNKLAVLLLENELSVEAVQELEAARAADSTNIDSLILLSRAYLQQKNIPAAGKLLESAIARGTDDAKIYIALSDVYQAGGYFENAIPAVRRAIEIQPQNEFYRVRYGLLLIDTKAPAAAIIRLGEAIKEFPNSARLRLVLGIAQQIDGKINEARISFERALQIDPKSVPALAYLATSQIEQGQYSEAAKTYENALALNEKNAILHYLLADTLLKIPASDTAVIQKHLKRSIELDEKFAPAHLVLGKHYVRTEEWQLALKEFEQAARYAPDVAETHYQLGRVLARLKRVEESKAAFERYKKLNETQTAQKETDRKDLVRRLANVHF